MRRATLYRVVIVPQVVARIVEQGKPDQVLFSPATDRVRAFFEGYNATGTGFYRPNFFTRSFSLINR
jgi:hypothetical protein